MSLEGALYSKLSTTAAITALVSTRIYPVKLPEAVTYPAVTYQFVAGRSIQAQSPGGHAGHATVQITAWADSYKAARNILAAILHAIDGQKFTLDGTDVTVTGKDGDRDLDYTSGARIFGCAHDYGIIHS